MSEITLCETVCTICGEDLVRPVDAHPGVESYSFCDSCAASFLADPDTYNWSNGGPVLDENELRDALAVASQIVAGLTFYCLGDDDEHTFRLDDANRQRLYEGQPVVCPVCAAPAMPGPDPTCPVCSSELDAGDPVCHVCE